MMAPNCYLHTHSPQALAFLDDVGRFKPWDNQYGGGLTGIKNNIHITEPNFFNGDSN